jgi:hypothetical protein
MSKSKGSGYFAAASGVLFAAAFGASFVWDLQAIARNHPSLVLRLWLFIAGAILLGWGGQRVVNGDGSKGVGQDTLNFVVAIVGVSFALFAMMQR